MRLLWLPLPLIFLSACKDKSASVPADHTPPPPPKISYSKEVRPLLISNCLPCHHDFPLHDPKAWDLLHQHEDGQEVPQLLKKWLAEGGEIDPHWAGLPLREIAGTSVDDFIESAPALETAREIPKPMFTSSVPDLLAGDLMPDPSRAISTGYLRRGEDTPAWRAELVAQQFLGMNIACARCHDHPSEHWSTERYQSLAELFTTPYDHLPKSLPPIHLKVSAEASEKLSNLKADLSAALTPAPVKDQDYLDWLALDEGSPSLPGLVAAYSFEKNQLENLALGSRVKTEGKNLIREASAHGEGLKFNGKNQLIISDLPITSELDPFTFSGWIKLGAEALNDTPLMTMGSSERGLSLRITEGKLQARWSRFWPQIAISVSSKLPLLAQDRWAHIAVTYDGSRQATGFRIYLNGFPMEVLAAPSNLSQSVLPTRKALMIGGKGLSLDEVQIYRQELAPIAIRHIFDGRSLAVAYQRKDDLRHFYQKQHDPAEAARRQKARTLHEALLQIENELPAYLVMASAPQKESIDGKSDEPTNRLEFAKRLNQDLLARSLANEVWRRHFGQPLTSSLGLSAPPPAHGDLLEWLAGKLKASQFKVAQLGELIRRSKAWEQQWQAPEFTEVACPKPQE